MTTKSQIGSRPVIIIRENGLDKINIEGGFLFKVKDAEKAIQEINQIIKNNQ